MLHMPREERWMLQAIKEAEVGYDEGEEPVGAVVIDATSGFILARAHQQIKILSDPTAHAVMIALTQLTAEGVSKEDEDEAHGIPPENEAQPLIIVTTREPCVMCAGAILLKHNVKAIMFGATRNELGSCQAPDNIFTQYAQAQNTPIEIKAGIQKDACQKLLTRHQRRQGAFKN